MAQSGPIGLDWKRSTGRTSDVAGEAPSRRKAIRLFRPVKYN